MRHLRAINESVAKFALLAFSLALVLFTLAASQQTECKVGAKSASGCDDARAVHARLFEHVVPFSGISAALSAHFRTESERPFGRDESAKTRIIPGDHVAQPVPVLALAPKTSPPFPLA